MVKNFDALKSALARANTPETAQSVRDLTGAIDRLHQSYANVYNGYSRTYVMMQELGTKEDGTVHDFTDEPRVSIANTALEDKKREVRDNAAVVKGLKRFLNNNPIKAVSVIIDTLARAPLIMKMSSNQDSTPPVTLDELLGGSVFNTNVAEITGALTSGGIPNWEVAMRAALVKGPIRLGSEVTRPPVSPLPYGDDTVYAGKHCGLLIPYYSTYTGWDGSKRHYPYAGVMWVEAALYTDAADLESSYLLVDVIRIATVKDLLDGVNSVQGLLDLTKNLDQQRVTYHSGKITSITARKNCQLYWAVQEDGLKLVLKDQNGTSIPTVKILNDIFSRRPLDGDPRLSASVIKDTDSVFADMSGISEKQFIQLDLTATCNAILADCNKYNFPIESRNGWDSSYATTARKICSVLGLFMEQRLTCDTYPLPMSGGNWAADGSEYTDPLTEGMFGTYLTGGYWLFNPQSWAKFPSGTLPAYCDLLPTFTRSELASVFADAYALFVGATRYGDILREVYQQSTVTDSHSETVSSNVSVGDIISKSLDYTNEDEILSAIESL